jgi:uncharacterized protein YkwD
MEVLSVRTSLRLRIAAACVLSSIAVVVTTAPADASRTDCVPEAAWPQQNAAVAADVVSRVNAYRAGRGLSQLQMSQSLTNAAAWKASQLAADGPADFSHTDPVTGRTTEQRVQACGYGDGFGENIALGQPSAESVMTAWLNSPGHRANLDYPGWVSIGVGAATGGPYGPGWAQVFGATIPDPVATPIASLVPPSATSPSVAVPLPQQAIEAPVAAAAPAAAAAAPGVQIMRRPKSRTRKRTARIRWAISGAAQQVQCALNGRTLKRCGATGRTIRHMKRGRHTFHVTVIGPSGSDTKQVRWRILRPR